MVEVAKGVEIRDLALYLSKEKALIIADLHLGFEQALNDRGVLIPRHQFQDIVERLKKILSEVGDLDKIIITGDLKHEFGRISRQEKDDIFDIIRLAKKHCKELIIVKGNHDVILAPLLDKYGVKIQDSVILNDIAILHGDKIPIDGDVLSKDIKTIIIGHEHPAIALTDGVNSIKYKCFMKGKWSKKDLVVLPSFNTVTEGTDILEERLLSPFLQQNLNNFEVWLIEDKPRYFGKIKELKKI
jgi:putative SbcD/Mre11-related phosphoesterase